MALPMIDSAFRSQGANLPTYVRFPQEPRNSAAQVARTVQKDTHVYAANCSSAPAQLSIEVVFSACGNQYWDCFP